MLNLREKDLKQSNLTPQKIKKEEIGTKLVKRRKLLEHKYIK